MTGFAGDIDLSHSFSNQSLSFPIHWFDKFQPESIDTDPSPENAGNDTDFTAMMRSYD